MDWRGRKYYVARFSSDAYSMRIGILKNIDSVRLHCPAQSDYKIRISDEVEPRGYYQILIGCKLEDSEIVEYELRKAERNDSCSDWKEIKRDMSTKYLDVCGNEMPYKKCDINPGKRCNHCMDC